MSTERDELVNIYIETLNEGHGVVSRTVQGNRAADAILAAGYRKPRMITTTEELDALPVGSAVRSAMGGFYVKDKDMGNPSDTWWSAAGSAAEFLTSRISLPATVLHEPEAQA